MYGTMPKNSIAPLLLAYFFEDNFFASLLAWVIGPGIPLIYHLNRF
jgi:hypothetical protein